MPATALRGVKQFDTALSEGFDVCEYSPNDIERQWLFVRRWIRVSAEKAGHMPTAELKDLLLNGSYRLYMVRGGGPCGAVVTTKLKDWNGLKGLSLLIYTVVGFGLDNWLEDAVRHFKAVAKAEGCERLVAYARPGLINKLKRRGAKTVSAFMTMDLEEL